MIDPAAGAGASRPAASRLRVRVPAMLAGVALVAAAPDWTSGRRKPWWTPFRLVAADLTRESADLVAQALRSAGGRVAVREG